MRERLAARGLAPVYEPAAPNHCPGCGRRHWFVGALTAECAFCGTTLLLPAPRTAAATIMGRRWRGPWIATEWRR
jgi:tRNA(Ile2) C34 agmatinyltransferase TiaS